MTSAPSMTNTSKEILNKTHGTAIDFKDRAMSAENKVEQFAKETGEKVGNTFSDLAESTASRWRLSKHYIKANPFRSLAIAAVAGMTLGSLLTLFLTNRD